ncbi:MAG TPA: helix-turn-helix domain-containing protein [Solimonas sp.]|nr:helix-turn-helix domain-containing protein [Solimonas sp.]
MSPENDVVNAAEASVSSHSVSPGALIRQGRERMNLSLDDLAGVTKLSYGTLEALERDDYSALLEAVYVRGYYRKCAKVLELSEKTLLEAYQNRVVQKQPEPPAKLRLASGADLGSASRLPVTLAIAAAVIAVVVCAIFWVARSNTGQPPQQVQEVPTTPAAPLEQMTTPATAAPATEPVLPAAADPTTPAVADPATAPAAAPAVPATPPAAVAPATPAAATTAAAVFSFTATSWVRVDDAQGKTVFNGLAQAGDSHALSGALPLNVFLGNAPAVTVQFNGQPVDTTGFRRSNNTARFTLPPRS